MQQTPNSNANRQPAGFPSPRLDEQTLMALQQMGLFPQLFQNTPSTSGLGLDMTAQNNDFLREILKAQMQMASFEGGLHNQQATKTPKELSRRRPSLMHDSGSSVIAHNDVLRPAQLLPATDNKKMLHHQLSLSADTNFIGQTSLPDSQEEEDEKQKRMLSERLDKIERERIQATNAQKNAQKKMRACEAVLRQEPLMLAEEVKGSVADSDEEEADELSPADALIERIYAENRRKASEMATNMSNTGPLGSHLPVPMANVNNARLMAEDAARLEEEFERGVLLLPTLVQAMKIQRERRQDALENRRIIYEEQLTLWERKVAVFERSPKKMAKDLRHRELFEKTFVELRKLREEKERNTRVERSRFSLAQGGNGIPIAPSETLLHFVSNNNNSSELPASEQGDNDGESVHEKAFAAAIVPPTYVTKPRRFYDNRNSIVDNPLADACAQLETLQNQWADLEKEVFMEKIAIYGKNFAAIAAFLPSKNVKECVQFYYMTKKRNNYKQKIGRRRKKIGRQGYQPPVMPRFGDSDENVQLRNYGREGTYVECLLCSARILVLESLSQQSPHEQPFDHHFGPALVSSSSQQQLQQQIPICSNCQKQELRNRQLNRCPLGSCACVSGKRKMRPVRNVPEKFASLSIERKRFLISRLKIPPSTNKCCTNCFKRINKDIDGLLVGELETELEEFNNRAMVHTGNAKVEPCLISGKIDEETENMVETKSELGEEVCTTGMEGPPVKEMKLEMKQEEDEFEEGLLDEVVVKTVPMETETNVTEDPLRPRFGSLTKGTPNRRQRSTLLGTWGGPSFRTAENRQMTDEFPLVPNFAKAFSEQQNAMVGQSATVEEAASNVLSQFNLMLATGTSSTHEKRHDQTGGGMLSSETAEIVRAKLAQRGREKVRPTTLAKADKDNNVAAEFVRKSAEHQRHDGMRRKSGLANALLPSPLPDGLTGSTSRLTASHRTVSPACAPTPKPAEPPPPPPFEDDAPKSINELLMGRPMLSTTTQSPSCYESLSEESDTEKGGEETTMAATKKNSAGLCSTSAAVAAPLNFFSLLDLMDETDNEQQQQHEQQRRTTTVAEPSAPTGDDASPASAFAAVAALRNQHQQQQQQLSILTSAAAQWADVGLRKTDKLGAERGEEECVYEPLSEDET